MLPEASLQKISIFFDQFKPLKYKRRDIILHNAEVQSSVFYIKSGYMRVYKISEQGEELTLAILKANDFFPMIWGVDSMFNNCYLEAITALEVWRAPQEQFMRFIKSHLDVFYDLTGQMIVRFGGLLTRMEYLITGRAYTKVATTILVCAKRFGEEKGDYIIVNLPLTHKDIATLVGITRETTCLEMKKMERKGLIAHQGRLLVIKDLKRLEEESLLNSEAEGVLNNLF